MCIQVYMRVTRPVGGGTHLAPYMYMYMHMYMYMYMCMYVHMQTCIVTRPVGGGTHLVLHSRHVCRVVCLQMREHLIRGDHGGDVGARQRERRLLLLAQTDRARVHGGASGVVAEEDGRSGEGVAALARRPDLIERGVFGDNWLGRWGLADV